MTDFAPIYRDFIKYKVFHFNPFQKVKSWEDFKYLLSLGIFCLKHIVFKPRINNETVRGR